MLELPQLKDCERKSKMIAPSPGGKNSRPVFVIAGSLHQCLQWVKRENLDRNQCHYVSSSESLYGVRDVRVVWVGTFWNRSDFIEISQRVDHLVSIGWVMTDRNEIVNKGRKTGTKADPKTGTDSGALS